MVNQPIKGNVTNTNKNGSSSVQSGDSQAYWVPAHKKYKNKIFIGVIAYIWVLALCGGSLFNRSNTQALPPRLTNLQEEEKAAGLYERQQGQCVAKEGIIEGSETKVDSE